jgi:hypothetical protein
MSTSFSSVAVPEVWASPYTSRCQYSVEQYLELARLDLLGEFPCELLDGWIVPKYEGSLKTYDGWELPQMVRSTQHDGMMDLVEELLRRIVPNGWYVRGQKALVTAKSVPEPDVAIVRGSPSDYFTKHPRGVDLALVVEVSESTLPNDRRKAGIYGAAGVPCYWIVNLQNRCIEVFESPAADQKGIVNYTSKRTIGLNDEVDLVVDAVVIGKISCGQLFERFPSRNDPT